MSSMKRKVAVVLSGGGAKGAYEAGALKSIVRSTQDIHIMTGASIGAINAAVFAWEYEKTNDMFAAAEKVKSTWSELDGLFKLSAWSIVLKVIRSWFDTRSPVNFPAFVDNTLIREKVKDLIPPHVKISDIKRIELAINATCLTSGKTVSFTRDNDAYLYEAVLASSCIPLIFETQVIKEGYYVDGGIFNNTPLRDALIAQATDVIVVELKPRTKDLYFETIHDLAPFGNVYQVGSRMIEMITDKIMYEDLKNARRINDIIDVVQALERAGENREIIDNLKNSIGYQRNGQVKRHVNFHEIAPSKRLVPPGTLGFENKSAIEEIIRLGERDAEEQLVDLRIEWAKRVS